MPKPEKPDRPAEPALPPPDLPVTIIQPVKGWVSLDLKELWRYRELFGFLVWRDVTVRYKQTVLGFTWALLVPVVNSGVFTALFGRLARMPTDGLPPFLFYMSGLVIWRYFATAMNAASNSLVGNQPLLTKIYLPRLIIPGATVITPLVDFAVAFVLTLLLYLYFGVIPSFEALLLPLLVLMAMAAALGVGLVFSALNVKYRDVREIVPILLQLWMWCTIILPFSKLPERWGAWRYLYGLNPMAGVVEGFRWCLGRSAMFVDKEVSRVAVAMDALPETLTHSQRVVYESIAGSTRQQAFLVEFVRQPVDAPWALIGIGLPVTALLLLFGLYYFKRMERQFADVI